MLFGELARHHEGMERIFWDRQRRERQTPLPLESIGLGFAHKRIQHGSFWVGRKPGKPWIE